jgi:hypothetical protein
MEDDKERSSTRKQQHGSSSVGQTHEEVSQEDHRAWAMEVYQEHKAEDLLREAEENILELGMDEEEEEISRKHLAMAIYYSCKICLMHGESQSWHWLRKWGTTYSSLSFTRQRRRVEFLREDRGDIKVMP